MKTNRAHRRKAMQKWLRKRRTQVQVYISARLMGAAFGAEELQTVCKSTFGWITFRDGRRLDGFAFEWALLQLHLLDEAGEVTEKGLQLFRGEI